MDADNKMSHICRTCLEQISDINYIKLSDDASKIKYQLGECIPELDLNLVPNAFLCMFCAQALQNAYDFKQKCLQTEKIIRNHVQGSVSTDLEEIKQDFQPESDRYNVQDDLGMEIVYIKDDELVDGSASKDFVHSFLEENRAESNTELTESEAEQILPEPITDGMPNVSTEFKSPHSTRLLMEELRLQSQVTYSTKKDSETTFCCSECNFKTSRSFLLKQHKVTHKEPKPPKPLKEVPRFVMKVKPNGLKQYSCCNCRFTTTKKLIFNNHQQKHKQFVCIVCGFKSQSPPGFSAHLRKKHSLNISAHTEQQQLLLQQPQPGEEEQLEVQPQPKEPQKQNNELKLKIKVLKKKHKSEAIVLIPKDELKCTKCNYKTSSTVCYQKHLRKHVSNGFSCKICNFVCGERYVLYKHYAMHKRVVKCPNCPLKVVNKSQLKYHLTLHTGDRQFKCKFCSFNAMREYYVLKHMLVHSDNY